MKHHGSPPADVNVIMNTSTKLVAYLTQGIHVGLYLILLTPLLIWPGFLFPHLTAKVLGFQILVELIAAGALALFLIERRPGDTAKSLLLSPLILVMAAFLGYSIVSAAAGMDPARSLWGFIDRQDGMVLHLHFFAWLLITAWYWHRAESDPIPANIRPRRRSGIRSYLFFSFWISLAVSLSALVESETGSQGMFRAVWGIFGSPQRLSGVFGNPIALGPYLVFHFFFGLYFLASAEGNTTVGQEEVTARPAQGLRRGARRYLWMGAVAAAEIIILGVISAGQSRGVIFGLILGLVFVFGLLAFGLFPGRYSRIAAAGLVIVILLAAAGAWRYRDSTMVGRFPVLYRLTHISPSENISTYVRLLSWRSGARGFQDHPLLGWGYDNIYYALNRYYDPRLIQLSPFLQDTTETWYDKSHNYWIDLLVERGAIGVMAFLLVLWVIAGNLWKMKDRRLALCLAGGLMAHWASSTVAFNSFGSLFGFYLTLAIAAAAGDASPWKRLNPYLQRRRLASRPRKDRAQAVVPRNLFWKLSAIAVILVIGIFLQVEMAIANHGYLQARIAFPQDASTGIALYQDAFEHFSPYAPEEKMNCAYLIVTTVVEKRKVSQSFEAGPLLWRLTGEALAAHPLDARYYITLNDMYNKMALYLNPDYAREAEILGKKALELSPNRQEAMLHLGRTYIIRNQAGMAVELNRRMLQAADFPLGRWLLGLSLLQDNQDEEARKEITRALESGYKLNETDVATLKGLMSEEEFDELTAGR